MFTYNIYIDVWDGNFPIPWMLPFVACNCTFVPSVWFAAHADARTEEITYPSLFWYIIMNIIGLVLNWVMQLWVHLFQNTLHYTVLFFMFILFHWKVSLFFVVLDCGLPYNVTNGEARYINTTFGSVAFYVCEPGTTLINMSGLIMCSCEKKWVGDNVTCHGKSNKCIWTGLLSQIGPRSNIRSDVLL